MIDSSIFSSIEQNSQYRLGDFAQKPMWVAWRNDRRKRFGGTKVEITKVPYQGVGREAMSNRPSTWSTLGTAAEIAIKIDGGFGICLGERDCLPGYWLGGVDLDCCYEDATLCPWAAKVVTRFNSYAEISPSGKGAKIFFLYPSTNWEEDIKPLLGSAKTGRQYKHVANHDHPPAIEVYLRGRFFAVTGNNVDGLPDRVRVVNVDDLKWLIQKYGPQFKREDPNHRSNNVLPVSATTITRKTVAATTTNGSDGSRSGRAFNWMRVFHRSGYYYQEARERILNLDEDPDVADWARTKGMLNDERELRRVFQKTKPFPGSVDDRLADIARTLRDELQDENQ